MARSKRGSLQFDEVGQHADRLEPLRLIVFDGGEQALDRSVGIGAMLQNLVERIAAGAQALRLGVKASKSRRVCWMACRFSCSSASVRVRRAARDSSSNWRAASVWLNSALDASRRSSSALELSSSLRTRAVSRSIEASRRRSGRADCARPRPRPGAGPPAGGRIRGRARARGAGSAVCRVRRSWPADAGAAISAAACISVNDALKFSRSCSSASQTPGELADFGLAALQPLLDARYLLGLGVDQAARAFDFNAHFGQALASFGQFALRSGSRARALRQAPSRRSRPAACRRWDSSAAWCNPRGDARRFAFQQVSNGR